MRKLADGRIPAVDAYIQDAGKFARPVLSYLREVVHEGAPEVEETIKWSRPFFVYRGVILGNMAAFKAHCSFGLWGTEAAAALQEEDVASDEGMASFGRIAVVSDLHARRKLVEFVRLAAEVIDDGQRTKAWSRPKVAKPEAAIPDELAAALKKNKAAAKSFQSMSAGYRREYCQWIGEAKREETRDKRAATAVEWIADGKSRNWKYEKS